MQVGSKQMAGIIFAVIAAVLWSLIGMLSKSCMEAGVSSLELAFWRAFLGGLCFMVQAFFQRGLRIPVRDAGIFLVFGMWCIGLMFGALQMSIQLSGAAMAMILLFTAPSWVAVFSRFIFKESISGRKLLALLVAIGGTALVCFSGSSIGTGYSILGIGCGLVAGLTYATQFPFFVWWNPRYNTSTIYTYLLLGGALALFPFVTFAPGKSAAVWGNLLVLGVVTNYVAYQCLGLSLQRLKQVQVAVINNIEPVLSTLWVWYFWNENFSPIGWVGSALIFAAVFLLTTEKASKA